MPLEGRREIYTAHLYTESELRSESLTFAAGDEIEARRVAEDWAAVTQRSRSFSNLDLYLAETLIYRRPLTGDRDPS